MEGSHLCGRPKIKMKTTREKAIKVIMAFYSDLYYDFDTAIWYSKAGPHEQYFLNKEVEKAMETLEGKKPIKIVTKIIGPGLSQTIMEDDFYGDKK